MPNDYPTDKYDSGLIPEYEKIFADLRKEPIKYLEVGILMGGSLKWAKDYFAPGSDILGIDMVIPSELPEGVKTFGINQNDWKSLTEFAKQLAPFDIIIDDGSHIRGLTENTFNALYLFLKPGGKYIIEDWGAPYFPRWVEQCAGMNTLVTDLVWQYGGAVVRPVNISGSYAIIEKV
jgi:demethylmacrocin O-methyltransferase